MIKTIVSRLAISGSLVLFTCFYALGQNQPMQNSTSEWIGAYLNVAGSNQIDGVELSTQLSTCGSVEVVILKFTNRNSYPVEVEWADAIYTTGKKWEHNETQTKEKIISIEGGKEKKGSCESTRDGGVQLVVDVQSIISDAEEFSRFAPSYFVVTKKGN
ncbi:MAG TPA: hypothetical protein EYN38_01255 [Flavobacteriales bacterium]|nr:hypothetical protein [Flavobacteriales bacterium]